MSTSATTLARPYARAAFESARAANALAAWAEKLEFAAIVAAHDQVRAVIGDPRLSAEQLLALFLPQGEAPDSTFAGFLSMLAANRRLPLLPEIAELFAEFKREHDKVLRVTVRAAVALDTAQADGLKAALKRRFGRDIEMHAVVDPSVVGGAVIDAGDVVIDGSVRGRLARLTQALTA